MPKKFLPLSWKGFAFAPLQIPDKGVPLAGLNLAPDLDLITVNCGGTTRVLVARDMAYHHVAQGQLNGEPYMVSF